MADLEKLLCDFDESFGKFMGVYETPEEERARWQNLFGSITAPIIGGFLGAIGTIYGSLHILAPSSFLVQGIKELYKYDSLIEQVFNGGANFLKLSIEFKAFNRVLLHD